MIEAFWFVLAILVLIFVPKLFFAEVLARYFVWMGDRLLEIHIRQQVRRAFNKHERRVVGPIKVRVNCEPR